nr:MAG TPA: hypothetical protein [Microviridae sp.]
MHLFRWCHEILLNRLDLIKLFFTFALSKVKWI